MSGLAMPNTHKQLSSRNMRSILLILSSAIFAGVVCERTQPARSLLAEPSPFQDTVSQDVVENNEFPTSLADEIKTVTRQNEEQASGPSPAHSKSNISTTIETLQSSGNSPVPPESTPSSNREATQQKSRPNGSGSRGASNQQKQQSFANIYLSSNELFRGGAVYFSSEQSLNLIRDAKASMYMSVVAASAYLTSPDGSIDKFGSSRKFRDIVVVGNDLYHVVECGGLAPGGRQFKAMAQSSGSIDNVFAYGNSLAMMDPLESLRLVRQALDSPSCLRGAAAVYKTIPTIVTLLKYIATQFSVRPMIRGGGHGRENLGMNFVVDFKTVGMPSQMHAQPTLPHLFAALRQKSMNSVSSKSAAIAKDISGRSVLVIANTAPDRSGRPVTQFGVFCFTELPKAKKSKWKLLSFLGGDYYPGVYLFRHHDQKAIAKAMSICVRRKGDKTFFMTNAHFFSQWEV